MKTAVSRATFLLVLVSLGWALDDGRGAVLGAGVGLLGILGAWWVRGLPTRLLVGGTVGLLLGIGIAHLLLAALGGLHLAEGLDLARIRDTDLLAARVLLVTACAYVGALVGARRAASAEVPDLPFLRGGGAPRQVPKILDTSVVIDGRIADIVASGFLEGTLVLPQFVLHELQQIADSSDPARRARGRRGLDIMRSLNQSGSRQVVVSEVDFPDVREVDDKLIELARQMGGKLVTNDFNLNKVAELRGVAVLNVNELANAVRPAVLVGEVMRVFVLKEGKEFSQGIAYLDDGTMVVVDNARRAIGKTIDVSVTSIHQTTAGKMIFGRWEGGPEEGGAGDRRELRRRPERVPAERPPAPTGRGEA